LSHLHERAEKICLNCGAHLTGRYCQDCGQENLEPKESFSHLVTHFFEDVTHFDGKFFSSIKYLFTKPGFLTEEYIKGRRASYLNPIRMYLFISALFFLVFMSFFAGRSSPLKIKNTPDSAQKKVVHSMRQTLDSLDDAGVITGKENKAKKTYELGTGDTLTFNTGDKLNFGTTEINGESWSMPLQTYDSLQSVLPGNKKDGIIKHYFRRKVIATEEVIRNNPEEFKHKFNEKFFHSLPYMFFLCLPLLALLLKLLYIRRREFYFVSHIVFIVHYFCTVFLLWLFFETARHMGKPGKLIAFAIFLGFIIYLYKGMRRFYKQRRLKTFVKLILFSWVGGTMVCIVALLFAANSLLNITS
jgi:hypothetical protein